MEFFNEKDLEFSSEYSGFINSLTQRERSVFFNKYTNIEKLLEDLLVEYNKIVADRLSLEAKNKFLEDVKQSIIDKTFDYKTFFHNSISYNLTGQEIHNTIWKIKSELP